MTIERWLNSAAAIGPAVELLFYPRFPQPTLPLSASCSKFALSLLATAHVAKITVLVLFSRIVREIDMTFFQRSICGATFLTALVACVRSEAQQKPSDNKELPAWVEKRVQAWQPTAR